jgi:integrase/recombinase XerD
MRAGLTRPEEITKPILERYPRYLFHYRKANGKPLLFGTQYGRLAHVRLYFRWLARQNAILWNPASDLDLPRRQRKLPAQVLTVAEVEKVMQVPELRDPIGLRDRAILEVLFATGMRRSELVNLDVYDVDGERATVHVP